MEPLSEARGPPCSEGQRRSWECGPHAAAQGPVGLGAMQSVFLLGPWSWVMSVAGSGHWGRQRTGPVVRRAAPGPQTAGCHGVGGGAGRDPPWAGTATAKRRPPTSQCPETRGRTQGEGVCPGRYLGVGAGGVFGPTCGAGPAPGPRSWTPEPPRSPGAPLTAAPLTRSGSASRAGLVWPAGPASPEGADEPRGPPGGHHQHDGRPCGASSPPPPRVPRPPPALTSSCVGPARSPGGTPFLPGGQQVGPGVTSELRVLPAPPPVLLS